MLAALAGLRESLQRCSERTSALTAGIDDLVARFHAGQSWRDIAEATDGPTVLERVNEAVTDVVDAAAALRREAITQLIDQGMTTQKVANRFHISRQRVQQIVGGSNLSDAVVDG